MLLPELPPLAEWESFYVIVGSSAAALTGLQFVVVALSADSNVGGAAEMDAFGTPTIVHFCAVLLLAALVATPGQTSGSLSLCFTISGLTGLAYASVVVLRTRKQTGYKPVLEDWIFHALLPIVAYACLFINGLFLRWHPVGSLYIVAATALLLLYVGIHNAWDAAIYISLKKKGQ
jgi:hypothetical protein